MSRGKRVWTGKIEYPRDVLPFYWADPHLGHGNIIAYCGRREFMSPTERELYDEWFATGSRRDQKRSPRMSRETIARHDEAMIANVNELVPTDGILVVAGDFCLGSREEEPYIALATRYREAIKCRSLHMVWGNHDGRCIAHLFRWTNEKVTLVVGGQNVVISHEALFFWDQRGRGARHYYGHTHARGEEELDRLMPGRFSQDVGVDNAYRLVGKYRPFSHVELEESMRTRSGYGLMKQE